MEITKRTDKDTKLVDNVNKKAPLKVFCRLRPTNDPSCIQITSPKTISINLPTTFSSFNKNNEKKFIFHEIFPSHTTQQQVFESVVWPLVEGLIKGKNGVLFTHGITGSGKTYTMIGTKKVIGVIPRCLQVIFKSIQDYQAEKFTFKSDKFNSFDIQNSIDAHNKRIREINEHRKYEPTSSSSSTESLSACAYDKISCVNDLNKQNIYAIYISYVAIYNNNVYDLLDDIDQRGMPARKIIRVDSNQNMYVHNVIEIEVRTTSEAMKIFHKAEKIKKTSNTHLNTAKSHSVFTVRLVQAPVDLNENEKHKIQISQLVFVDLATPGRAKNMSNINNSLLNLRICLSILYNNLKNNENSKIPYRDSKLTYLFKKYFEKDGLIRMIVCLNPSMLDFDESFQVLKFTQLFQDDSSTKSNEDLPNLPSVFINHKIPQPTTTNVVETDSSINSASNFDVYTEIMNLNTLLPQKEIKSFSDFDIIMELYENLKKRIDRRQQIVKHLIQHTANIRECYKKHYENFIISTEDLNCLRERITHNQAQIEKVQTKFDESVKESNQLADVINKKIVQINQMQVALNEQKILHNELMLESVTIKQEYRAKAYDYENHDLEQLNSGNSKRKSEDDSLSEDDHTNVQLSTKRKALDTNVSTISQAIQATSNKSPSKIQIKRVARNCSTSDNSSKVWLEHRDGIVTDYRSLLKPIRKRVEFNGADAADIRNSATNYCLIREESDTEGEIELQAIKGEIVPTRAGGVQVNFNDMEILKSVSIPTLSRMQHQKFDDQKEKLSDDIQND